MHDVFKNSCLNVLCWWMYWNFQNTGTHEEVNLGRINFLVRHLLCWSLLASSRQIWSGSWSSEFKMALNWLSRTWELIYMNYIPDGLAWNLLLILESHELRLIRWAEWTLVESQLNLLMRGMEHRVLFNCWWLMHDRTSITSVSRDAILW